MFFWNSLAFSMIQWMLAIWSLFPLPFLNPAWKSGSFWFNVMLKLNMQGFKHELTTMGGECNCPVVSTYLSTTLPGNWEEAGPFLVLWPLLSFPTQSGWHIECSTWTASSCRIWNSSAEISSPPPALFIVMLPKAHLTSHSRMSTLGEWHGVLHNF